MPEVPRIRPVQPGCIAGLVKGNRGTLGLLLKKNGSVFGLGCSHAFARSGAWADFSSLPDTVKSIRQPPSPTADGFAIGTLTTEFTILQRDIDALMDADFAIFALAPSVPRSPRQLRDGTVLIHLAEEDPGSWQSGMSTQLFGAVTPLAAPGQIIKTNAKRTVLDVPFVGDVRYEHGVLYQTACDEGDSGGVVTDSAGRILGLHVAGIAEEQLGYFLPITQFLKDRGFEPLDLEAP